MLPKNFYADFIIVSMAKQKNKRNRKKGYRLKRKKSRNIIYRRNISYRRNNVNEGKQYWQYIIPNYKDIIVFLIFLTIGLSIYFYTNHLINDKKTDNGTITSHVKEIVGRIKKEYPLGFWNKYPGGYRVVILTNKYVIPTEINTLPVTLDIDWRDTYMLRIPPEMKKKNPYLVRIKIPSLSYPKCDINKISVSEVFTKIKGTKINLINLCGRQFVMEILESYEDYIICLFGIEGNS